MAVDEFCTLLQSLKNGFQKPQSLLKWNNHSTNIKIVFVLIKNMQTNLTVQFFNISFNVILLWETICIFLRERGYNQVNDKEFNC